MSSIKLIIKNFGFLTKPILPGWTQGSKYDNSKFHHLKLYLIILEDTNQQSLQI